MQIWIDAHTHFTNEKLFFKITEVIESAEKKGVQFFLQGGVDPADWQKQQELKKKFPNQVGMSFGLHPYFIAANSATECELSLNLLADNLSNDVLALGEIGLDFRPHIMKDSREQQIEYFSLQLELAQACSRPVILHIVQAFDEALQVIDLYGLPNKKGFVHAFNGSWIKAQAYIERGLLLSIGGALFRPNNQKLIETVRHIPLESLLLESDSPDQGLYGTVFEQENHPESILLVAEKIAAIRGISCEAIRQASVENFKRLFPLVFNP